MDRAHPGNQTDRLLLLRRYRQWRGVSRHLLCNARIGLRPWSPKAFTLSFGDGPALQQCREFLGKLDGTVPRGSMPPFEDIDVAETFQIVRTTRFSTSSPASMAVALCRASGRSTRTGHPFIDGDGGDENLRIIRLRKTRS
ncbi:MAG: hypothetical protein CM1200mP29_06340 [Verrucomicrobiota bacterium]|nr:MAG: hypothetical protein CM1200mP29_06340 [Verrucomicrobiota bacterium]